MKDVTIYTEDRIFGGLIESEIKKLGKSVTQQGESCILLIVDADSPNSNKALSDILHTFTVGISYQPEALSGFDSYLRRPLSLKELRETVNALFERKVSAPSEKEAESDEIILLSDRKSVLLNGNKIGLTPNEFILLEHLITHRGNAVSREKIKELLGGDGNTPDVYICMLRKKLTVNRRSPIVTLRGKGYKIV